MTAAKQLNTGKKDMFVLKMLIIKKRSFKPNSTKYAKVD